MRRVLSLTLTALVLLATAACGSDAGKLPEDEVVAGMAENADKAENYRIKLRLIVQVKSGSLVQSEETVEGNVEYIDKESPDLHASYVTTTKGNSQPATMELYKQGKQIFSNENGQGWNDASVRLQNEELLKVTHADIVGALKQIEEELSVAAQEGKYSLTYSGTGGNVYEAFRERFTIKFKGVDMSKIHSDLKAEADKDTLFLRELHYEATGENARQTVTIRVDLNYDQINEIKEVTIPKDIPDTAKQPSK